MNLQTLLRSNRKNKGQDSSERYVDIKPGRAFYEEGNPIENHDCYYIKSGSCEILKDGVLITVLNAGSLIGEQSLVSGVTERT